MAAASRREERRVESLAPMGQAKGLFEIRELTTIELPNRRATTLLGRWLAQGAKAGDLIVLSGDLGAGKTFLARAMARAMGVPKEVRVTSPTFNLVHEFTTTPRLLHADLYRIADASEIGQLLLREARCDGAVLLVEWGEPFLLELGGDGLLVRIELAKHGRIAKLGCTGHRSFAWSGLPLPHKPLVRQAAEQE